MADDTDMADGDGVAYTQNTTKSLTDQELDEKYPNRPHNHSKTLPFHDLYLTLFNPLAANRKKKTGPPTARKKQGPDGPNNLSVQDNRRAIVERFFSRWRNSVGNDVHPAIRLILPEKDRERAMYGLKEATIAKLLTRAMKIDKDSEDAFNLRNWKSAGVKSGSAGDFPGRCFEVLSKRPLRTEMGNLTIEEVNEMLDRLSVAQKEEQQFPIFSTFYQNMNPEEMTWIIRIILRQMKVGATEKTILNIWHPDAETLFSVSSNLRRVCWELWDPEVRLTTGESDINLMQCFQPQLAQFKQYSIDTIVKKMNTGDEQNKFWVEEKLDGERMQMHMINDKGHRGGKRFAFWSRKAKDYTYLYGNGLHDDDSALTRHLGASFDKGVRNIILDGEMITWDPKLDRIVGFGTLKTAALEQQKNPHSDGQRPLFKVFDIVYLNDQSLTKYTLADRRKALHASVRDVHRRMEIHQYTEASTAGEIEPLLRGVVNEAGEGLVVKNPRSDYKLNDRNDDWIKVKPEYMTGHGSEFDCIVIGGYYGSGRRGGFLSSFLCGLTPQKHELKRGVNPQRCLSFFKVGGGFSASDYAEIQHKTEGKWQEWDSKKPPSDWILLGGGEKRQYEKPDEWIKPEDSVVLAVKAASINATDQFATRATLRFPRLIRIRNDRDWKTALTHDEFDEVVFKIQEDKEEQQFQLNQNRRKRPRHTTKKELVVAGQDGDNAADVARFADKPATKVFEGLTLFIMTAAFRADKKTELHSKSALEAMAKANGALITQSPVSEDVICIADREAVSVSGLKKKGMKSIIRPSWVLDCIRQAEIDGQLGRRTLLLPYEPRHVYSAKEGDEDLLNAGTDVVAGGLGVAADEWGDSFCRDVESVQHMRALLNGMPMKFEESFDSDEFLAELGERLDEVAIGGTFKGYVVYFGTGTLEVLDESGTSFDIDTTLAANIVHFAGGRITDDLDDEGVTTIIVASDEGDLARTLMRKVSGRSRIPHVVTLDWVMESWEARTLLDEGRFVPNS